MKDFLLDKCPNFGEVKVTLGKDTYELRRCKNNGCILSVWEGGFQRDEVVFTMQDLRAFFMLLTVNPQK